MKRLILTVFTLLLGINTWAQNSGASVACNLQIKHQAKAPSCYNGMDAGITLQVSGAMKPYTVQWSDEGTGEVRTGIPAGLYNATVRDVHGCVKRHEVQIPQGQPINGELSIKQSGAPGSVRLSVHFANGSKPFAVKMKNLSEGVRAPWTEYKGEALKNGVYMLEAFTNAGCSQISRVDLRIQ